MEIEHPVGKCWAAALGGCSADGTKEHLITRAIWNGEPVEVEGFPWCKGISKRVGANALAAHILCKTHNNLLSSVDEAAATAMDVFRQACGLAVSRQAEQNRNWDIKRLEIAKPDLLERWFIKTAVDLVIAGVGSSATQDHRPQR
jgi:hypothetical protein